MWTFMKAGCFSILISTTVLIYAKSTNIGACDDNDGVCRKPDVDEAPEVELVSAKVLDFENEAVSKAVAVLQSLGYTHAIVKDEDLTCHSRH